MSRWSASHLKIRDLGKSVYGSTHRVCFYIKPQGYDKMQMRIVGGNQPSKLKSIWHFQWSEKFDKHRYINLYLCFCVFKIDQNVFQYQAKLKLVFLFQFYISTLNQALYDNHNSLYIYLLKDDCYILVVMFHPWIKYQLRQIIFLY